MKAQIEYKQIENELHELRTFALQKKHRMSMQGITELAFKIASDSLKYLDSNSFEQITGLKK
jgi:hypothetical protein